MRQALEGETADHPLFYRPVLVARRSSGPASHASGWVGPARPVLRLGSTVVAQYEEGASVDSVLSPRPFLDNVVSRAGTPLSVTEPTDHPHHLGVSLAIPDVNGTSYWGGRTYVRGEGSIMVPNHGRQRRDRLQHRRPLSRTSGSAGSTTPGRPSSSRCASCVRLSSRTGGRCGGAATSRRRSMRSPSRSPATNGRDGAGYGGIFWRFAPEIARVFSPAGDTERDVHGAATPWIAFTFPERGTTRRARAGRRTAAVVRALRRVPRRRPLDRVGRAAHDPRGRRAEPRAHRLRPRRRARGRRRGGAGAARAFVRRQGCERTAARRHRGHPRPRALATSTRPRARRRRGTRRRRRPARRRRHPAGDARSTRMPPRCSPPGGSTSSILCTPIPTHADLALRALAAGAHVLLEKPPVVVRRRARRGARRGRAMPGRAVQVGFQSLGSAGVAAAQRSRRIR